MCEQITDGDFTRCGHEIDVYWRSTAPATPACRCGSSLPSRLPHGDLYVLELGNETRRGIGFYIEASRKIPSLGMGRLVSRSITPCPSRCAMRPLRTTIVTAPARDL